MTNIPNFFIVGGPKCGTTAMVEFLRTHPDIFISEPKESNYLADDMPKMKFVDSRKDYLNLFKRASQNKIIADGSIFYMFSQLAIKNIYRLNPEAKLLVMIRNPIEMVPSFHDQIVFTLDEDEVDLNKALDLEDLRRKGKSIPKLCRAEKLLNYSEIARYGDQIENIYKHFSKKNVKVVLFDDFKKNNRKAYLEVLSFLNLEDDGRKDFPRINDAKRPRSKVVNRIVNRPPKLAKVLVKYIRKILNKPRLGILNTIDHLNRDKLVKKELSNIEKEKLLRLYKDDIKKTEKILNIDLSSWIS